MLKNLYLYNFSGCIGFFFLLFLCAFLLKCDCLAFSASLILFFYILPRRLSFLVFFSAFYIVYIHIELAIMGIVVLMSLLLVRFQNSAASILTAVMDKATPNFLSILFGSLMKSH